MIHYIIHHNMIINALYVVFKLYRIDIYVLKDKNNNYY